MGDLDRVLAVTVEEALRACPAVAHLLGRYGIDLCRCFPLALGTAARIAGADPQQVARAVRAADRGGAIMGPLPHGTAWDGPTVRESTRAGR